MNISPKVILIFITILVGIASLFVFGVIVTGHTDPDATPLITTVLGFISLSIISMIGLLTSAKTQEKVQNVEDKVDKVLNGNMDQKIRDALTVVLKRQLSDDVLDDSESNETVTKPKKSRRRAE